MAASLASYSAKESANAAEGSVGANGLKPSMVARRFIAALRTSAALSPSRPMPRSATTSQCDSGIAFFSAIVGPRLEHPGASEGADVVSAVHEEVKEALLGAE
jgi:hypothetical protein